jgi:VIT1/CCC1 family predicted Fe2+/Mn2+ transporter
LLSDFILGSQDGIANVLGILLGLAAATSDVRLILVGALAALGAESISMAAVAYTSTLSRRQLYLSEEKREKREMREIPEEERAEVRDVLEKWGYQGKDLDEMEERICRNPTAMLEFMMAFELKLSPTPPEAPRKSAIVVGGSTTVGHLVPLLPFFFIGLNAVLIPSAEIVTVVLSGIMLFFIGYYEAKITVGSIWRSGARMVVIGLGAGFAGFLIGHFLSAST